MSFLDQISARLPFGKREENLEYFFALNIGSEKLLCALWTIEHKELKIISTLSENYPSLDELTQKIDKLLDETLGTRDFDVQKILFGVPSSWLDDGNLKDEKLKVLRSLVKELELTPMAYVENSLALVHFLEKQEGVPPTAILIGFEKKYLTVTVARAGKIDGAKAIARDENSAIDIEKALLTFVDVETLPSKILIYGLEKDDLEKMKTQLLSFSWMSKLSFLHFPKIEILTDQIEVKSICLAGAAEIEGTVSYKDQQTTAEKTKKAILTEEDDMEKDEEKKAQDENQDLGFVVGDIAEVKEEEKSEEAEVDLAVPAESNLAEVGDFESDLAVSEPVEKKPKIKLPNITLLAGVIGFLLIILGAYLFLPKADVKIFVEPKVVEKDTQVVADPNQKNVDEDAKIIPAQIVETEISGTAKESATGKKQIGNAARGFVKIINNTTSGQSFSKGAILASSAGLKFIMDNTASVSATPADADSKSTVTAAVTAADVGADGNIPTQTNLTIGNFDKSQFIAKAEGNFSGGTSQTVTVVSSDDQQKLLASLSSNLRKQAQQKLQQKLPQKKILEEALKEEIIKKSFSKNINDQASEFSLNLSAKYQGTAFEDKDLKLIVSKLVNTDVPEGFQLNLEDTETQADVSKIDKGGKLIFLARFKAKLLPKIDTEKVKNKIKGKSLIEASNLIKSMDNVLGADIKLTPALPPLLQRIPILSKNIKIDVGLK